jgi:hypothetical protein
MNDIYSIKYIVLQNYNLLEINRRLNCTFSSCTEYGRWIYKRPILSEIGPKIINNISKEKEIE